MTSQIVFSLCLQCSPCPKLHSITLILQYVAPRPLLSKIGRRSVHVGVQLHSAGQTKYNVAGAGSSYHRILLPDLGNSHLVYTSTLRYTVLRSSDYASVSLHLTLCQPNTILTMASDNHLSNERTSANNCPTDQNVTECNEREVICLMPQLRFAK
jgi:hypothetical protein